MTRSPAKHRFNVPAARGLRDRQTLAESILWAALRHRALAGLKFRRQHPIGTFVVDFCCPDRWLIIEVDGSIHDTQREQDAEREALLIAAGYRVLRFRLEAIIENLPAVLEAICTVAAQRPSISPAERRSRDT